MRIPCGIVALFLFASLSASAQQYNIATIAGGSPPPTPVTALNAPLGTPGAVTSDPGGNIYFVTDDCVFKIDTTGNMTRIAGNSRVGFSGDGGPATLAQLNNPGGLAADSNNLYIADSVNNRIRRVTLSNGTINTFAGTGTAGYSGDGAAATNANLNNPQGLALDSAGDLYVADAANQVIRRINPAGTIATVAGNGTVGASGDGQPATSAQLNTPNGVAVDASFNIYIADSGNHRIRKITGGTATTIGTMSTIAGNGIPGFQGDNGLATVAELNFPTAVALDPSGLIYLTDFNNSRVRRIAPNGVITTVAGGGSGGLTTPTGITVDPTSNLYIDDSGASRMLKFSISGASAIFAGTGVRYYLGDGGAGTSAQLVQPQQLAVTAQGVYIADRGEGRIRQILPGGNITSTAGATGLGPAGVAVDSANNLYLADAVGNQVLRISPAGVPSLVAGTGVAGFFGDNGSATSAQLNQPSAVAVDTAGNVYIADTNNNRIRKVTAANGIITTLAGNGAPAYGGDNGISTAALVNLPTGIAVDQSTNIYIADTGNNRIRKINGSTGIITTVAGNGNRAYSGDGGPATSASINTPHGVALDSLGNLYVPDYSARVRKVSISGVITTIAGNGTSGYSGDNGPALSGELSLPWGVTVDGSGTVYVSDVGEQAVRILAPVAAPPLSVTTTSPLPTGTVGLPYAQTLLATGGTPPYAWTTIFGSLPAGVNLSSSGSITGTPTASGSFLVTFQVTDSASVTATATLGVVINPAAPGGLTITTQPNMIPGAVGVAYNQVLAASGGTPPYTFTVVSGSLPTGLGLTPSGLISGTPVTAGTSAFTIRLNDNTGAAVSAQFSLTVISVGTLTRTGAFGHIAVGGTWSTRFYISNISTAPVAINLLIRDDNGNNLNLPFTVTQQGTAQQLNNNSFTGVLNANTEIIIDSGAQIANLVTGWVDVLSSGAPNALAGFAIFRTPESTGVTAEGTTPLQTVFESKIDVPYDDTSGYDTAVAIANLASTAATVTATVFDTSGNQLGTYSIQLAANGHSSFLFPTQFAVTQGQQGIVQFNNTSGGNLAGVALRASTGTNSFTSVPVILP